MALAKKIEMVIFCRKSVKQVREKRKTRHFLSRKSTKQKLFGQINY